MSTTFRYKNQHRTDPLGDTLSPLLPVVLKGKESLDVMALLDSGADTAAIPKSIAEIIGLKLTAKPEEIKGIGDGIKAVTSKMNVVIKLGHETHNISTEVKVINDDDIPVILGRKDFFERFTITFKEKDKKMILKKA